VGIPLTRWDQLPTLPDPRQGGGPSPALLVVGQNPGFEEDKLGFPFVGQSGKLLQRVYLGERLPTGQDTGPKLHLSYSIYLTNAVRCGCWGTTEPTKAQYDTCLSNYFISDLLFLLSTHSSLVLLLLGGPAIHGVYKLLTGSGKNAKEAFAISGDPIIFNGFSIPTFSSFNPAYVLQKNSVAISIVDHLQLLRDFTDGLVVAQSKPDLFDPFGKPWTGVP